MDNNEFSPKTAYFQRLPHIQPIGATFFVTFHLHGSIPWHRVKQLKYVFEQQLIQLQKIKPVELRQEKIWELRQNYFQAFDDLVNCTESGPFYLKQKMIARLVKDQLHQLDGQLYELDAYCIMPNHVHILINTSIQLAFETDLMGLLQRFITLDKIMKRIKGPTAIYANRLLARKGQFWERESYDSYIRNEWMFWQVIQYILEDPVKAGIVGHYHEYEWNYVSERNSKMDQESDFSISW